MNEGGWTVNVSCTDGTADNRITCATKKQYWFCAGLAPPSPDKSSEAFAPLSDRQICTTVTIIIGSPMVSRLSPEKVTFILLVCTAFLGYF